MNKLLLLLVFFCFTAPEKVSAGIFSDSEATIVVRSEPSAPYSRIYIVFDGSISEMVAVEEEIEKIFSKSKIIIHRASADISTIKELGTADKLEEIRKKITSPNHKTAMIFIKPVAIEGYVHSFNVTLVDFDNAKTVAVGDIRSDTENKTISNSSGVNSRVAARQAIKLFVTDKKVRNFFVY